MHADQPRWQKYDAFYLSPEYPESLAPVFLVNGPYLLEVWCCPGNAAGFPQALHRSDTREIAAQNYPGRATGLQISLVTGLDLFPLAALFVVKYLTESSIFCMI